MKKVWIDGRVVDEAEAKVSVLDHGILYGDGVFEGIRCIDGYVVDLDLHLARLTTSAKAIHLALPELAKLESVVFETLEALGKADAYVRLVVTRGPGALGIDVTTCTRPTLFCIAGELQLYAAALDGIALVTVSSRRPAFDMLDPRVKSLNYLNNVLAKYEAKARGADEALVLNHLGTIAEASAANVFASIEGVLVTPPPSDGALSGITRRRILKLARAMGIETEERSLTRVDLFGAEEVFLTGTGAGIVKVGSLDGEALGSDGELATRLAASNREYARVHGRPILGAPTFGEGLRLA